MTTKERIGTRLRRAITNNFWLKLISLVFAVTFYGFIHSAQNSRRTVTVKVVAEMPDDSVRRRLVTDIPPSVDVMVAGPLQQLEQMRADELAIRLNLQAAQNIPELELTPALIDGLPPRVRVERIQPSKLNIRFEKFVEDELVPVQVARTGEPAEGMEVVGKPIVKPAEIMATGIESVVTTLQYARAETFDVSGLAEGKHRRQLRLDDPPPGVTYDRTAVEVMVEIRRQLATREFSGVAVEVVGVAAANTRPRTVDVRIQGPPERVESLREESIVPRVEPRKAGVDLSQPGSADLPVIVDIPNVQVTVTPPTVFVKW